MKSYKFIFALIAFYISGSEAIEDYQEKYPVLKDYPVIGLNNISEEELHWRKVPFESLEFGSKGCNGVCPVHIIKFYKGGKAEYIGGRYATMRGKYTGKISLYQYTLLCSYIERTNLLNLQMNTSEVG